MLSSVAACLVFHEEKSIKLTWQRILRIEYHGFLNDCVKCCVMTDGLRHLGTYQFVFSKLQ